LSICIETVAVLAYRKFLIVSADSGASLGTMLPPFPCQPSLRSG
jgi:hypothetical protein